MLRVPFIVLAVLLCAGAADAQRFVSLEAGIAALSKGELARRVQAANYLARCGKRPECVRAIRALERTLFDAHPTMRRAAINSLVTLDARATAGSLVRLLRVERDVTVLPAGLIALGSLRVEGADDLLTHFAAHRHPAVRAAALTAAGDLGGARNRRLLLNSLQIAGPEDSEWFVRASAMLGLAKAGQAEDLALVQRVYREGGGKRSWLARSAVAQVVAALHPDPQATLERLLMDPDPRVAASAAAGLLRAGLEAALLLHLRNPQASVRAAAVAAVSTGALKKALPRLRRMARWDTNREVRFAVAVALFEMRDPLGDELMLEAIGAKDPAVWARAIAHLARRTGANHGRDKKAWTIELERLRARR